MGRALTILLLASAWPVAVAAQPALPKPLRDVGFDQKLDAQVPPGLAFKDESGRAVKLGDYFGDKPVVLVLAYFRCPLLCNQVLNGLLEAMLAIPFDAGQEYRVVTVSFDPRETPEMARLKKRTYVERYARAGADAGWHFLTGDAGAIRQLTDAVGFRFTYDAKHDQFAHASGIMVLTPQGRVSRYFYDIKYSPRDVRFGLIEASANKIGSPVDKVLLFCFHYDPAEGKYGPAVMAFVRLGGVATVIALGAFLTIMWRHEIRQGRQMLNLPQAPGRRSGG